MPLVTRISAIVFGALCSFSFATESGELLDAFNQYSVEGPTPSYEQWEGVGGIDSEEYKNYFREQFNAYGDTGIALAERALACSAEKIPQSPSYQSMYEMPAVFELARNQMSRIDNQMLLWVSFNDQGARKELDNLIPPVIVTFGKALLELSSCSGYLSGELVN